MKQPTSARVQERRLLRSILGGVAASHWRGPTQCDCRKAPPTTRSIDVIIPMASSAKFAAAYAAEAQPS